MQECWSSGLAIGLGSNHRGGGWVEGMLTRYNKKTVTIITDEGRQWNVSPDFLSKFRSPVDMATTGSKMIPLRRR